MYLINQYINQAGNLSTDPIYSLNQASISSSLSWWRHQMETFSALLAICAGNSPVHGEFPAQRPVTRSFDVFLNLRLNKRLRKQSWGWWVETLSRPFLRHCNDVKMPNSTSSHARSPTVSGHVTTLKQEGYHINSFCITGCTEVCQDDAPSNENIKMLSLRKPSCFNATA